MIVLAGDNDIRLTEQQALDQLEAEKDVVAKVMADRFLDSHKTAGHEWPNDAEFAVVYNQSAWPTGWCKESTIKFFGNREELDSWIRNMEKWGLCEDNYFAYQAYQWDLGPELMVDLAVNTGELRLSRPVNGPSKPNVEGHDYW